MSKAASTSAVDPYVDAVVEVVAEARALARRGGHPIDDLPDEDILRRLLRLREAVARCR